MSNTLLRIEAALRSPNPDEKCQQVFKLASDWRASSPPESPKAPAEIHTGNKAIRIEQPGFPPQLQLVHPRQLKQRGLGSKAGRIALLHAIAHIEFNAINLALDAVARFIDMPRAYYTDWLRVAEDEARHFQLIAARLDQLGTTYGELPAHNGLWDMALRTAHDPLHRMALVPRVMEARGLDVTPPMIEKLRSVGDTDSAEILDIILREEIAHVAIGTRWFHWLCEQRALPPETTWTKLVREYFGRDIRQSDINTEARQQAGFNATELDWLKQA